MKPTTATHGLLVPHSEASAAAKFLVAATFTAEPVAESLNFWLGKLGIAAAIEFAPYNQVFQQLLQADSALLRNKEGVNVLLIRLEDWASETATGTSPATNLWRAAREFSLACGSLAKPSSFIVCFCPSSEKAREELGEPSVQQEIEAWLIGELTTKIKGLQIVTSHELVAAYPVSTYNDSDSDELGHIPYTPEFFISLGTTVARKIYARSHRPYKVIVLDCDDVLWSGICGEVGPLGVEIDDARREFHRTLIALHARGMLLCLCSKNNREDALEVFRRPEMELKLEHLVGWRINWKPKSENLRSLAEELRVGLDSFIFLDDSPLECAEVRNNCPEVLALQLPRQGQEVGAFIKNTWALDVEASTSEDRDRTRLYQQDAQREQFRQRSLSLADFLAGLELTIQVSDPSSEDLARVAQLTQRTNQFNCTTIRRSEQEIRELLDLGTARCLAANVSDRFGNYGLVGVLIFSPTADSLAVDTFLLSCRALGRGVELQMLRKAAEVAEELHKEFVDVRFVRTPKNQPAQEFMERAGGKFKEPAVEGVLFRFPVEFLSSATEQEFWTEPRAGSVETVPSEDVRLPPNSELIQAIAAELRDPKGILRAIRQDRKIAKAAPPSANGATRTPIEELIVGIWSEVLGIGAVGVHDDFFLVLGGDSLLGTQVVSRLRQTFKLQIPLRTLFEAPTVAGLAKRLVEGLAQSEQESEVVNILAELEEPAGERQPGSHN